MENDSKLQKEDDERSNDRKNGAPEIDENNLLQAFKSGKATIVDEKNVPGLTIRNGSIDRNHPARGRMLARDLYITRALCREVAEYWHADGLKNTNKWRPPTTFRVNLRNWSFHSKLILPIPIKKRENCFSFMLTNK